MYLLIELLVDLIRNHTDSLPISMERLLKSLPSDVAGIYDRMWSLIPAEDEPRAGVIFPWILCAFRPLVESELSTAIARFDRDSAMKPEFEACWKLKTYEERRERRSEIENPLNSAFCIDSYWSQDRKGDLNRLFGPLVHLEARMRDQVIAGNSSLRVMICHRTVKDHFLIRFGFIEKGKSHLQMALLCARILDGTLPGDLDTEYRGDIDDLATLDVPPNGSYTLYWERNKRRQLQPTHLSQSILIL
ncbi:hypothetical protein K469DRAFT_757143 [Zopfia rhizophila CBS 207.26]|uniref:Uncharacterized protein n=1 Tax=Zopfia rhizophila CBS 207.26 TaxID=1314779 RepID=A0A6A6EVU8_9PEZI|nr:hypothetical protein K469DRAFT_757143 [Zopfia rhizophila CBS 207.26]